MRIDKRLFAGLVAALTFGMAGAPAVATAACPVEATTQPFAHVGDYSQYFLVPGGDFEGADPWYRTGNASTVQSGAHGFDGGVRAAFLPLNSSVISRTVCFDADRPHLRLAARALTVSGTLRLDAIESDGDRIPLARFDAAHFSSWRPTPFVPLLAPLGLDPGESKTARLRLTALSGEWLADAVYVDPYKRG